MVATLVDAPSVEYPTTAEFHALAERARRRGVRIAGPSDRPIAYDPIAGAAFDLTDVSCTCRFFVNVGECQHHALFVEVAR